MAVTTVNLEYKALPEDDWSTTTIEVDYDAGEILLQKVAEQLGNVFYREVE